MSTSGNCKSLGRPRNALGFLAAAPANTGRAGLCCTTPLRYAPTSAPGGPGDVVAVDNLTVRNRLTASYMLGGTLTINGIGDPNPLTQAGLCVKTGASIDGVSRHGALQVVGDSCMGGPLTVSTLYGPIAVMADPAHVPAYGVGVPVLTTVGGAIVNGDLLSTTLEVTSDDFTVGDMYAGPLAASVVQARALAATVTLVFGAGPSYTVWLGTAVSSRHVLTMLTDDVATTLAVGNGCSGVARTASGVNVFVSGAVSHIIPAVNAALVELDNFSFTGAGVLEIAGPEHDSPAPGAPIVSTWLAPGGSFATPAARNASSLVAVCGSVSDAHVQLYDTYTSVALSMEQNVPASLAGSPVVDFSGRLVAMWQTVGASPVLSTAKGRYLAYFVKQALNVAPGTSTVRLPYSNPATYPARGIGLVERAIAAAATLVSGGVSVQELTSQTALATQLTAISIGVPGTTPQVLLGSLGQNNPSYTDTLAAAALESATASSSLTLAVNLLFASGTPSGSITQTNLMGSVNSAWWLDLQQPADLQSLINSSTLEPSVTFTLAQNTFGVQYISNLSYDVTVSDVGTFYAATHGNGNDTKGHTDAIVAWGVFAQVDTFLTGLGGFVNEGWQAFKAANLSLPPNIMVLGVSGTDAGSVTCEFYATVLQYSSTSFTVALIWSSASVTASVSGTALHAPLAGTQTLLTGQPALNCFAVTTNSPVATSSFTTGASASTVTMRTAPTSSITASGSILPPAPIA
jgi:hypothetical protein